MIARMGAVALILFSAATSYGLAQQQNFVAPPRTISDITAILDSEKPDFKKIEELKGQADTVPTGNESRVELAKFYYDRGSARWQLGRETESIADGNKAMEVGRGAVSTSLMVRFMQLVALQYHNAGDLQKAFEVYQSVLREVADVPSERRALFWANRQSISILTMMGDVGQAEAYQRQSLASIQESGSSDPYSESEVELGRAILFETRGKFGEAEAAYRLTEQLKRSAVEQSSGKAPAFWFLAIDRMILNQSRMKARQGRLVEAEVDARRALLSRLKSTGKYNSVTDRFVMGLADILVEQGRYAESEQLQRVCLEIHQILGIPNDSQTTVTVLSRLGEILTLRSEWSDATAVYDRMDKATANWDPQRRKTFELDPSRILSLYNSGQLGSGIATAEGLVKMLTAWRGAAHADTASARGILAIGLMRVGRDADAQREFKVAIPGMMANSRENADEEGTTVVALRNLRRQTVVEAYFAMLARDTSLVGNVGEETFSLADAIRGRSVQQALAASSARAAAKDPALEELVRREQDLSKEINAQFGMLATLLSLRSEERDAISVSISALRAQRDKARQEINQKFPAYADLVSPKPPSIAEISTSLTDGEAMLSFYFGLTESYVWAVPKAGPVAFAAIKATSGEIESKIRKLREALEPQVAMIADIPPFDLKVAYELYSLLLKPVENAWKPAKNLVLVTNGALGLLPLSLLPTGPAELAQEEDPLFAGYRNVPWLARTHSVTVVPSAASLRTLRQLPAGNPGRSELVAFGDPYFNKQQQSEAESATVRLQIADASGNVTRGIPLARRNSPKLEGVDSAELGRLPRLPDTAEELKSIALALQADPSKVLFLGKYASEGAVKTMNLSGFKILAFATHGLVPGELNGLIQPALALSSPTVTGEDNDGLLTMEEILGLKLDADWVVLSACNTGAGAGAGAEAASGLGRAFFYAGTRALLVTNWSVHSQSARELVTDLFKRQAEDLKLTRGEALRAAMMAMVDISGYVGADGKAEFSYAHPLFWAPYSIIGDGGRH
jgi:CHAT domain-containing protein